VLLLFVRDFRKMSSDRRAYNFLPDMQHRRYALVAYVKNAAGDFVENLRRELHPESPHLPAHLTILPPRTLRVTENAALRTLERICGQSEPFEINLGGVETFCPITPTVYIRVEGAARMCDLHQQLNTEALAYEEEWPYIPHLTIAKMGGEETARSAFRVAAERWEHYSGSRRILLEKLTFVREDEQNCWVDIAPVQLGQRLVSR
jgi:2'-5' RNA ligase